MSRFLFHLGQRSARHPWRVIGVWLVIAVVVMGANAKFGAPPADTFTMPGTESQQGIDLLKERFPSQGGATGQVVIHTTTGPVTDPSVQAEVQQALGEIGKAPHVVSVSDPYNARAPTISPSGTVAFASVQYDIEVPEKADYERVVQAITPLRDAGVQAELSGAIAAAGNKDVPASEAIGLLVAIVVLLVAFGSVIAMGIPIGTALFGIMIGMGGVGILGGYVSVPSVAPMIATMIGLGVGIDYALFVVTRHRQHLHEGMAPADAAGTANATAGQAVLFAGMTVVIAICGLQVSGIPAISIMGYACAIVVAVAMIAAVTLLPALLGLTGTKIDKLRLPHRKNKVEKAGAETFSGRWAHHVGRRPWRYAIASLAVLLALAAPMFALRIGFADESSAPRANTERKAYDLMTEAFGPGFNGQVQLVGALPPGVDVNATLTPIVAAVSADANVLAVGQPAVSPNADAVLIPVMPKSAPQDEATDDLVHRLRSDVLPKAEDGTGVHLLVTGQTAALSDLSNQLMSRLPWFIAAVVMLSFLLLLVVFRSILVPLKAAIMNLLSIGAAYGVVVAVFQWGWGKGLIGLEETVPINPFVPMMMFAILFGLSMDYEVFLLSRVREEFLKTGDSHTSVVEGLTATARVITSAALIMISVFAAFILDSNVTVKMFGLGLSVAVLIDATIVRMVLVPSTMSLLGKANWWVPKWLDRILPHLDFEGVDLDTDEPVVIDVDETDETPDTDRELVGASR